MLHLRNHKVNVPSGQPSRPPPRRSLAFAIHSSRIVMQFYVCGCTCFRPGNVNATDVRLDAVRKLHTLHRRPMIQHISQRACSRRRLPCWLAFALCILAVSCCSRARVLQQWRVEDMEDSAAACVTASSAMEIYNIVSSLQEGTEEAICISTDAPQCVTPQQSDVCIQHGRESSTLRALGTALARAPRTHVHATVAVGFTAYPALPLSRRIGSM